MDNAMLNTRTQHGEFVLTTNGNVLIARLSGSWNEEAARAYAAAFREQANALGEARWGHLVLLDEWQLGVPEIAPVIEELVHWCIGNGLIRAAQVYSPSLLKRLQLDDMISDHQDDYQRRAFATLPEALVWLEEGGFRPATALDDLLRA